MYTCRIMTVDPNQWQANDAPAHDPRGRAAVLLWILGGLQLLVFSCCTLSGLFLAIMPRGQIDQALQQQAMGGQFTAEQMQGLGIPLALTAGLLGVVPAFCYLVAGFFVRKGHATMTNLALLLIVTQLVVFGMLLLVSVAVGIATGRPLDVTVNVLTMGTLVALLVAALRSTWQVKQFDFDTTGEDTDPWNQTP